MVRTGDAAGVSEYPLEGCLHRGECTFTLEHSDLQQTLSFRALSCCALKRRVDVLVLRRKAVAEYHHRGGTGDQLRLSGDALIWNQAGLVIRIESGLDQDRALSVAGTVR